MSFWGKASAVVAGVAGTYVGAAHGAYKVITRTGTFDEGFETTYKMMEAAEEFGDKHGEQLTGAAITVATTVMKGEIDKRNKHTPPSS